MLEQMNEVQGPTPTGTSRPYRNLAEALRAHRIDPVNHEFIGAIVEAVGVTALIDRGRYIEALRRGDNANLHIGRTYTNGFTEDEAIVIGSTRLRLQPSEGRAPYFYVSHPSEYGVVPQTRTATKRSTTPRAAAAPRAARASTPVTERDYGVCDVCFMVKTPAGGCGCN